MGKISEDVGSLYNAVEVKMVWLGLLVGVLLGFDSNSITGFIGWVAAGWFTGHVIGRLLNYLLPDKKDAAHEAINAAHLNAALAAQQKLENRVQILQKQMDGMAQRLLLLEQLNTSENSIPAPENIPYGRFDTGVQEEGASAFPDIQPASLKQVNVPPLTALPEQMSLGEISEVPDATSAAPHIDSSAPVARASQAEKEVLHRVHVEPAPAEPETPSWLSTMWTKWIIGGNPLVKIGVLILFLGLAFLLRFAAEHAVFPVELRYVSVAVAAIGLLITGWRWRERQDNYGLILQGGGIGVLYLTTLASMKLHALIPPAGGFVILIAVAASSALLAILQNSLALAVAGTLGGFAAPVLSSTGNGDPIALFSYLAVLNSGIVAIAWFKAWRLLNVIGFLGTFTLGSAWALEYYHSGLFASTEPFVLLMFALYVVITFLFAKRTLADVAEKNAGLSLEEAAEQNNGGLEAQMQAQMRYVDYVDGFLVFGVPFATFGWQYLLVRDMEYGAAFSALGFGLVYILLGFALFRRSRMHYALLTETAIALAVIFGSLAIPLALESAWTSAVWAVEAAGMYWVGRRQQRIHARVFALLLLSGSAFSFASGLSLGGGSSVLAGSWVGCVLLACGAGWIFWQMRQAPFIQPFEKNMRPSVVGVTAFFAGLLPFLLWPMEWAAPALAVVGALAVGGAFRLPAWSLLGWGGIYQVLAGILFASTFFFSFFSSAGEQPSHFWGALLISLAGFLCAWVLQRAQRVRQETSGHSPLPSGAAALWWAGLWWCFAWVNESARIISMEFESACLIGIAVSTAWLWSTLAQRLNWPLLGQASLAYLPALAFLALASDSPHPFAGWGALAWPVALIMHGVLLRRQEAWIAGSKLQRLTHSIGVWLFIAVAAAELRWQFASWSDPDSAWSLLGWIIAPVAYLWMIVRPGIQGRWPVRDHRTSYLLTASLPLIVYVTGWVWVSNAISHGAAWPLPYIPVLNPLEMAHIAVIVGVAGWGWAVRDEVAWSDNKPLLMVLGGSTAWAVLTGVVLRTCHHWGDVPWSMEALFSSSLVQASLSIVWSCVAIALMVSVHRHQQRWIWMVGASLMAIVVVKLFMVELAARGSVARIVSFIGVGVLLLLVGYFAPLPPKPSNTASSADE